MTITNAAGDLIARLRAATKGSRELDCEIATAVGFLPAKEIREVCEERQWRLVPHSWLSPKSTGRQTGMEPGTYGYGPPAYTTSLDAAASLMRSKWDWQMDSSNAQSEWRVLVWDYNNGCYAPIAVVGGKETAPLALCIAFMEARQ